MKTATKRKRAKFAKIEAKPLSEQQIKEFVEHFNKHKKIPGSKIPCNATGKLTTCVGAWLLKKVKEYGGIEKLLRNYKSRGVFKAQRDALKPVKVKRPKNEKRTALIKETKDGEKEWDIPKVTFGSPQPLTDSELTDCTKTACLRPDVYLNNDGYCNGCKYYDLCVNRLKRLAKESFINSLKKRRKAV